MKIFRAPIAAPLAIGLAVMLFQLSLINYPVFRADNVYALLGAWSLSKGLGYCDISTASHTLLLKYPPLISWPMIPWADIFGPHLKFYRLSNILLAPLQILLICQLLRPRLQKGVLFIGALFGIHYMVLWGQFIFSSFALFSLSVWTAIYALTQLDQLKFPSSPSDKRRAIGWECALPLAMATAFYCHRMALCLIAATILYLVMRHSPLRSMKVVALCFLMCAPWLVRSHAASGKWLSPEYEAEIHGRFQSAAPHASLPVAAVYYFVEQGHELPANFAAAVSPWNDLNIASHLGPMRLPLNILAISATSLLILVGWLLSLKKDGGFVEWYFVAHLIMVSLFIPGVGYFMVLFPFIMLYLARGVIWSLSRINLSATTRRRMIFAGAALQFTILLAHDKMYSDQIGWPNSDERDKRWSWVQHIVPVNETVFWMGLPSYAWAPWRFFDSERFALGEANMFSGDTVRTSDIFSSVHPPCEFAAAPITRRDWQQRLLRQGWRPVYRENSKLPGAVALFRAPSTIRQ